MIPIKTGQMTTDAERDFGFGQDGRAAHAPSIFGVRFCGMLDLWRGSDLTGLRLFEKNPRVDLPRLDLDSVEICQSGPAAAATAA